MEELSPQEIKALKNQGIHINSLEDIKQIKSRSHLTLSDDAAKVDAQIQQDMASSVTTTGKVLKFAGGTLFGYIALVALFTALFIAKPLNTAQFLGIVKTKTNTNISATENKDKKVLAAETSVTPEKNSVIQTLLQPIGKVSLGLVRSINPTAYTEV